jgi:tRNA nucleotidyltransferase/poly(A) polymerase
MKYSLESLRDIFPHMDFNWCNDKWLNKVINKIPGEWRYVGGCVRDSLLGIKTKDIDITCVSTPEDVEKALEGYNLSVIGKKFGTIGVFIGGWKIEITTVRKDVKTYGRAADVVFTNDFKDDSDRRDFTINALMLSNGVLYDYHGGINDLKEGLLKFIGDANCRIEEDYLRMLRYVRFFLRFDNKKSLYTELFQKHLEGLKHLSSERVFSELEKIIYHKDFKSGIRILNESGICNYLFGNDLVEDVNENLKNELRFILVFQKIKENLLNYSIPKPVRKLYSTIKERYLCPVLNAVNIWTNSKNPEYSKDYLIYYMEKNGKKTSLQHLIEKEWIKPTIDLSMYEGINRGKAEKIACFLYLMNMDVTNENMEKIFVLNLF